MGKYFSYLIITAIAGIHDFSFLQKRKNLRRMPRQQTTNRHCRTDIAAVVPEIGYFFLVANLEM